MKCPGCGRRIWFGGHIRDKHLWHISCCASAETAERIGYERGKALWGVQS